jgi:hypothetical protein
VYREGSSIVVTFSPLPLLHHKFSTSHYHHTNRYIMTGPAKRKYVVVDDDKTGDYEEEIREVSPFDVKQLRSHSEKSKKDGKVSNMILFTAEIRCSIG